VMNVHVRYYPIDLSVLLLLFVVVVTLVIDGYSDLV
jgi:hypothetical protein